MRRESLDLGPVFFTGVRRNKDITQFFSFFTIHYLLFTIHGNIDSLHEIPIAI